MSAEDEARKEQLRKENEEMQAQLSLLQLQIAEADGEIQELKSQGAGAPAALSGEEGVAAAEPAERPGSPAEERRGSDGARGKRFIATKKLAVRSGIEANTRKVGSIAPGELVIGLEQQISNEGALRVRSAKGWVSATNVSGAVLLRPALDGEGMPGSPRTDESSSAALPDAAPLRLPSKADLIELAGPQRPPPAVITLLGTVRVVLEGKDTSWHTGKSAWAATGAMLKNQASTLIKMKEVVPALLSPAVGRRLAKLINDPDFHPAAIAKQCRAAASVAKWCGQQTEWNLRFLTRLLAFSSIAEHAAIARSHARACVCMRLWV